MSKPARVSHALIGLVVAIFISTTAFIAWSSQATHDHLAQRVALVVDRATAGSHDWARTVIQRERTFQILKRPIAPSSGATLVWTEHSDAHGLPSAPPGRGGEWRGWRDKICARFCVCERCDAD